MPPDTSTPRSPLVTAPIHAALLAARDAGGARLACSLDLGRSTAEVLIAPDAWQVAGVRYPYLDTCRDRTIYRWTGTCFEPIARYTTASIKLVPTDWGPPTFEIDGIKMLPSARVSPVEDAARKVALVAPQGRTILDTCGGLGYFAAQCLSAGVARVQSYEKNADVLWLRSLNPWSPEGAGAPDARLVLEHADVTQRIGALADGAFDAVLHDPPRFGIAGELYSLAFYAELARVLRRRGRLFHYTGAPNSVSRGRDLAGEVVARLRRAGFAQAEKHGDGVLATR